MTAQGVAWGRVWRQGLGFADEQIPPQEAPNMSRKVFAERQTSSGKMHLRPAGGGAKGVEGSIKV